MMDLPQANSSGVNDDKSKFDLRMKKEIECKFAIYVNPFRERQLKKEHVSRRVRCLEFTNRTFSVSLSYFLISVAILPSFIKRYSCEHNPTRKSKKWVTLHFSIAMNRYLLTIDLCVLGTILNNTESTCTSQVHSI